MSIRIGIVGIIGFGGGEAMRLVASHSSFELTYAAGEGSAGSRLGDRFPGMLAKLAEMVIEKLDPAMLPKLDVRCPRVALPRRWRVSPRAWRSSISAASIATPKNAR